jgi:hypothetical protein
MPASAAGANLPGGGPLHPDAAPASLIRARASRQELTALRADFPQHDISRDSTRSPVRYVSRRLRCDVHPCIVVTPDPSELRAILQASGRPS